MLPNSASGNVCFFISICSATALIVQRSSVLQRKRLFRVRWRSDENYVIQCAFELMLSRVGDLDVILLPAFLVCTMMYFIHFFCLSSCQSRTSSEQSKCKDIAHKFANYSI